MSDGSCSRNAGEKAKKIEQPTRGLIRSRFLLTDCAFADPKYWYNTEPPDDPSMFRTVRDHEVAQPARKGLLVDILGGFLDPARRPRHGSRRDACIGLADGSASVIDWPERSPERIVLRPYGSITNSFHATRRGLHGIDF